MEITDQKIIEMFYGKQQINAFLSKKYKNFDIDDDICRYLKNRFKDSESLKETLYRIKNNIEIRPVCKTCGR